MQPKIISKEQLFVTGLTGNGSETGEVWGKFEANYENNPFAKADENEYEIRFFDGHKPVPYGKDIHVGFLSANAMNISDFTTITLPATEYAVFDVYIAEGYDSGNKEMDKWLSENSAKYSHKQMDGVHYVVECYNEKFKDGNQPDSIVEIWIPLEKM